MSMMKITGNKVSITEAMEQHVHKKFNKTMEGLLGKLTSASVHFSKNNNSTDGFKVSADLHVKGTHFYAEEFGNSGDDFYGMVDELSKNIERQVNKRRIKFESDKKKGESLKRMDFSEEIDI